MNKRETQNSAPVFFTICSKNLLGYAKTWVQSVKRHHPESEAYVFLADRFLGPETGLSELNIVTLEEHGGSVYRDMMFKYNITEFNTSIKPFCFLYLFEKYKRGTGVVYMDPDTWVHSSLSEVEALFAEGSDCVLTPHMTEPMGYGDLSDRNLMRYGAYNFGFVGIKNTEANEEIVCWWADELKENCVIDYPNGLFVDQKYGDLFPSFFNKSGILRHQGYNIAYWNLFTRTLRREPDDSILVNGDPLRFLHFSGASMSEDSPVISRHCQYLTRKNKDVYGELLDQWIATVNGNDHTTHLKQGYSFFWNSADKENEHSPQSKAENTDLITLERSHWMYMAQFKTVDLYEKWTKNESGFLERLHSLIEKSRDVDGRHMFCNCCFNWLPVGEWNSERSCPCGASDGCRLLNAFLYQELKLQNSTQIFASEESKQKLGDKGNPFYDVLTVSENLLRETRAIDQIRVGVSFDGLEHLEKFETSNHDGEFIHQAIVVDGLGDNVHRDLVRSTIESINREKGVRASLFVGMSVNHFLSCENAGIVYIENVSSVTEKTFTLVDREMAESADDSDPIVNAA